jgi:hypothetical protein
MEKWGMAVVALVGSSTCISGRAGKEEERLACGRRAAVIELVVRRESVSVNGVSIVMLILE